MSSALLEFRGSLHIAQELLTLEAGYPDPPTQPTTAVVQGLRGGATVLMVAAFEEFLSALFLEHLSRLDGTPPPVLLSQLSEEVQAASVFSSLQRALSGPRYQESEKKDRLQDIRVAAQRLVDDRLDPASMSEAANNPDSKSVKSLFKGVGQGGILTVLKPKYEAFVGPVAQTYLRDRLDGIVQNRHVVAHTGAKTALNISRKDLAEWMLFLDRFAELLDAELDAVVTGWLPPAPVPPIQQAPAGPAERRSAAAPSRRRRRLHRLEQLRLQERRNQRLRRRRL